MGPKEHRDDERHVPVRIRVEDLGGLERLRALIETFVDRVFDDILIGFHFRNASRERIKELEFQHAAAWLGAELRYTGRALNKAHKPHRITGGQFARRLQILREVLREDGQSQDVIDAFIAHQESLRSQITHDSGSECHE